MRERVYVVIRDPGLRRALTLRLCAQFRLNAEGGMPAPERPQVILTTNSDLRPEGCRDAVGEGHAVVVLAALPRREEEANYLDAGATAYLAMGLDSAALQRALESALSAG